MSEQKSNPIIDALIAALAGIVVKEIPALSEKAINAIFHKHKKKIAHAAVPITEDVAAATKCPQGQVWDGTKCVDDVG